MTTETSEVKNPQIIPQPPPRGIFYRDPPILGPDGQVARGGMWPSQGKWWALPNFVRLFVGGYGSGKTLTLCKRHIELALANAPIPTAIVSPTYSMANETVVSTLVELLEAQILIQKAWGCSLSYEQRKSPPYQFVIEHQGRDAEGKLCKPKRGRILIYSGEDPKKLKGPNLSSAGIDEPFIQDYEVFEQMSFRARHAKSVRIELNLTGTPEQLNWGYELAEGELKSRFDVGIVQMSTVENKAISTGYVERLLDSLDSRAANAYVHGMFVNLSKGAVYYAFDRKENVVELEMPEGAELGVGMDFNVNPMAGAPFWYTRRGSVVTHVHYFDEIELANSDTKEMCSVLRHHYGRAGFCHPFCNKRDLVLVRGVLNDVYPDSNVGRSTASPGGKTDYDFLREAGFEVHKRVGGNPPQRDRYNAMNNMLAPVQGRVRVTVSPRCQKLIKYLMLYTHELKNRENQKAMSHLLDAGSYPVSYLCPSGRDVLKHVPLRGA